MTVIEIAQLTTGIATLIVAIIILWQTGLSRKDSDIDLTYKSLNTLMNRFGVIFKDETLRRFVFFMQMRDGMHNALNVNDTCAHVLNDMVKDAKKDALRFHRDLYKEKT